MDWEEMMRQFDEVTDRVTQAYLESFKLPNPSHRHILTAEDCAMFWDMKIRVDDMTGVSHEPDLCNLG